MGKTVSMECQTYHTIGVHSSEEYGLMMMGEGLTYQERLYQQVRCTECNTDLVAGYLD